RPTMLATPLCLGTVEPSADTLQVFQGNPASGAFGFRNQPLADDVVDIGSKAPFLAPALLEQTFRRPGAPPLQAGTEPGVSFSETVEMATGIGFTVGVSGDVLDAKVHAEIASWLVGHWLRGVNGHVQKECPVPIDEIGLTANPVHACCLVATEADRHQDATVQGQQGDPVNSLPGEDALVVGHRAVEAEGWLDRLIALVGFDDLGDGTDGHLGREAESFTHVAVDEPLERDFVRAPLSEGHVCNRVTGSVESFQRPQEGGVLAWAGRELDDERLLHSAIVPQLRLNINTA